MAENFKKNIWILWSGEPPPLITLSTKLDKKWYFQNSFLQVQRNIFSLFLKHQNFRNLFRLWTNNFWQSCKNCILLVQRNVLGEKHSLEKSSIFITVFRTLLENFSDFQRKLFDGIVKNAFYESIETDWDVQKYMQKLISNWQIPEKTNQPNEGKMFSRKKLRWEITSGFRLKPCWNSGL